MNEVDSTGKAMVGFCRISYTPNCFLFICGTPTRTVDYFPVSPYQAVLDSGVRCYNEDLYPGGA